MMHITIMHDPALAEGLSASCPVLLSAYLISSFFVVSEAVLKSSKCTGTEYRSRRKLQPILGFTIESLGFRKIPGSHNDPVACALDLEFFIQYVNNQIFGLDDLGDGARECRFLWNQPRVGGGVSNPGARRTTFSAVRGEIAALSKGWLRG
jgi:hypothetical protein